MYDLPDTRHSLLVRLGDHSDHLAWAQFAEIYEPVVYRLARSRGLQHADALDLVQNVLAAVAGAIDRWTPDPARGRFRNWLFRISRNLTVNILTRGGRLRGSGDSEINELLQEIPAASADEATCYDLEFRREAFLRAADRVRDEFQATTWQAFWLTAVEGVGIEDAARQLGISLGSVYAARSRVLARLRKQVEQFEGR
ncbi:MAG: RNA polymerase sigma factor [Planctomycetaceae bacterium]|nr:RNA polymerase sigma factor [Planctomycetaceae bacterium]